MATTLLTVGKRTRVQTAHLLLQRVTFYKAPKIHGSNRPILPLREVETDTTTRSNDDLSSSSALMVTYTAFDPGASQLLPLSNALPASFTLPGSGSSTESKYLQTNKMSSALPLSLALPKQYNGSITSTQQLYSEAGIAVVVKPWPYYLPAVLQPQPGTTYDSIYGDQGGAKPTKKVRAGWLQKVLYGDPEL